MLKLEMFDSPMVQIGNVEIRNAWIGNDEFDNNQNGNFEFGNVNEILGLLIFYYRKVDVCQS